MPPRYLLRMTPARRSKPSRLNNVLNFTRGGPALFDNNYIAVEARQRGHRIVIGKDRRQVDDEQICIVRRAHSLE